MGLLTGLLAGAVIVLFRLLVEGAQAGFLPGSDHENFEALPLWAVFLLPVSGGIALAVVFRWWAQNSHVLGVARLMERMAYHQGYLSVREFFLQFIGAALAIASGHSVGREGPHIFLGAASGSLLGQFLALPNNSIRTMAACGTAAGIAASFNTPLAGVIFALEVVMLEYTLASFVPVMIAATSATAVSVFVFGSAPAFLIPQLQLGSLAEMPLLLVLGVVIGTVAALFVHLLEVLAARVQAIAFWWRVSLAGLFMGLVGMVVPEVMGIGYDTVNAVLMGQVGMGMLAVIVFTKLIATVVCVGMGVPGGMISPSLFMGAVLGSLTGLVIHGILPESGIDAGVYALLGMGAMMGATLQAPLAALTAMMELTYSPQIIMPGMLVVVVACLTASEIFRKESLFITMLKANGMDYNTNPVMQSLRRMGVASVMDKAYARTDRMVKRGQAEQLLADEPDWILVEESREPISLMRAMDLARHLGAGTGQEEKTAPLDLMGIPAHRSDIASIHIQATLQEAWDKLEAASVEALFVERTNAAGKQRIFGVVTRETLESAYRY
ncbi:MAG: chloride channel protein [Gammaproteobacteria bacterium]|nr:chloride channel protein [Gammaproteobacteria bacterium]